MSLQRGAGERYIREAREKFVSSVASNWKGYEQVLLLEIVRSLDEAAFAMTMAPNRVEISQFDFNRQMMLRGAASAMRPLLEAIGDRPGGVPWAPSTPELTAIADRYLIDCGKFSVLHRLTAMEKHGLAKTSLNAEGALLIEVPSDVTESAEVEAGAWLGCKKRTALADAEARMVAAKDQVANAIDKYTKLDGWFIAYDPTPESVAYHRDYASILASSAPELDALPEGSLLGGKTFASWNDVAVRSLGRVFHHIACSTRMRAKHPVLDQRNLSTTFARTEDVVAVWEEEGETAGQALEIVRLLTLDAKAAAIAEHDHEIPLPYYVKFGRDFVLLPIFGGLLNPHAGLTWNLKASYRADWDRSVEDRESVFRNELANLFAPPRYDVLKRGHRLKRADGSVITDVDAIIVDRELGIVALVQLKWPDVHGRSLAERESRRRNLLKANDWVARVSDWVAGRSSAEIARGTNMAAGGANDPVIVVIARHAARFANEQGYDRRAKWVSWPELVRLAETGASLDKISDMPPVPTEWPSPGSPAANATVTKVVHRLPGIEVHVVSRPQIVE